MRRYLRASLTANDQSPGLNNHAVALHDSTRCSRVTYFPVVVPQQQRAESKGTLVVPHPAERNPTSRIDFLRGMEITAQGDKGVEQTQLLIAAMAQRCQNILQDKTEDVRFGLPNTLRPKHLRWMCKEIAEHAGEWPTHKSHRWIGFVQAGMIANYMLDLDGAKAMFNQLREQYGAISNDQDLLDHLDPSKDFEMETGGEG